MWSLTICYSTEWSGPPLDPVTNNVIKSVAYIFSLSLENTALGKNSDKTFILWGLYSNHWTQFLSFWNWCDRNYIDENRNKSNQMSTKTFQKDPSQDLIVIKTELFCLSLTSSVDVLYINRVNIANPWLHLIH